MSRVLSWAWSFFWRDCWLIGLLSASWSRGLR